MEDQLRDAASQGTAFFDPQHRRVITAVRLGSEPIASFAIQGAFMPDSVLQGIGNLIAIGLERARAQDLAHQVEAARRSEQLRTTLLDAMAHEFKTRSPPFGPPPRRCCRCPISRRQSHRTIENRR